MWAIDATSIIFRSSCGYGAWAVSTVCSLRSPRRSGRGSRYGPLSVTRTSPLRAVADPAAGAFSGELHTFHFLLTGLVFESVEIPDLGVFVGEDIALDFRSGEGWDPAVLGAFVRLLASLRDLEDGASIGFWRSATVEERERFADTVTVYLAHRRQLRR